LKSIKHFVIPDTQVKKGVPIGHLRAAGNYAVAKKPDVIIHLGDHFDMPSLSYYDIGTIKNEGARYQDDIDAGIEGIQTFLAPIKEYNKGKRKKNQYHPRLVYCLGNHEYRIVRHVDTNPKLEGKLGLDDLQLEELGFEVYDYQEPVEIDGIIYCHNFVNMASLKKSIIGGTIENKLKHIGQSFTMGHQQQLQMGVRYLNSGKAQRGLVVGAFYQHDEEYMGRQGNYHFRGCIMKHEVKDGNYNIMELSLDYLLKKWG
jgi:hypothetical protein